MFFLIIIMIYFLLLMILLPIRSAIKTYKNYKNYENMIKIEEKIEVQKYDYYREIPNSENTAMGVAFLVKENSEQLDTDIYRYRMIQATILELHIAGYLEIIEDENKNVILRIIDKEIDDLKFTQYVVLKLIIKMANHKKEIPILEFKKEIRRNSENYNQTFLGPWIIFRIIEEQEELGNCKSYTENERKLGNCKSYIEKERKLRSDSDFLVFNMGIVGFYALACIAPCILEQNVNILTVLSAIIGVCMIIVLCWMIFVTVKVIRKAEKMKQNGDFSYNAKITRKGKEEAEKWKGFRNYLREYTLVKDYEVESIIINEEYLVYATLFGIANETQRDLGKYGPIIIDW